MNIKMKKLIATVTGGAIVMGVLAPLALTGEAAALQQFAAESNAIVAKGQAPINDTSASQVSTPEEQLAQAEQAVIDTEVLVTDSNGAEQSIKIAGTGRQTNTIVEDSKAVKQLQQEVERGKSLWLLYPVAVVKKQAAKYGFNSKQDSFTLISQVSVGGKGKAYVLVGHGKQYYLVELSHPVGSYAKKIWQISSIKEVNVVAKPGKPDVGSGVVGLDYNKALKWQQNVDEGREQWRLDPLQVAKNEGKQFYGLKDNANFTIIRKLSSSQIARHGQIDLEVIQNGKRYVMILVRPFGSDAGAIWTTYRVYETSTAPQQPQKPVERVIFQTDKYKDWNWYKPEYPQEMGAAVIFARQMQLKSQQIPQSVFDKLNKENLNDKVALAVYLGGTSSVYKIGIEKVTVKGNQMTVNVRTKSPERNAFETRDLVYPADILMVDRKVFTEAGQMHVTFIDQNGKILSKVKVTVS